MKKYISLAFMAIALTFGFTSCCVETNEEPGGTNVEKMAGRWNVMVDAVDESGTEPTTLLITALPRCGWTTWGISGLSR